MAYRVDLTERAARNLRRIYLTINAEDGAQARAWFNGLEKTVLSLDEHPARGAPIPEGGNLRHLLYGRRRHYYRIIYAIDEGNRTVTVLHIRHGARDAFLPNEPDEDA
ncbi:MAG: type II toxin-antitoxin system RelE/ParE family toxin [Pseudomonadota bacterium]|nr:type II toxin-antitoxin system RelE/ParE family toxin [Pseudomonadota bacterium]